ncbi:MAG: NAD(P)-dependent oxidoreductase [Planctomycetes bacterium]|nr:NAD(P)-dependent oxidoreductase [Planctomycetota bacterium]
MGTLAGRTVLVTGASRGIGRAIALRVAADGANVVLAAKSVDNTGKLPGTIHEVAEEVRAAGGHPLPFPLDVRDADRIEAMAAETVARFGGIDVLVNNAGAIALLPTESLPVKALDLMLSINPRASLLCARACIPHLKKSANGHILTLSPPIDLAPRWFGPHTAYTISKFAMTMLTLGLAEELRPAGVAANSLWPRTTIATAAVAKLGGEKLMKASRTPAIMADAAHAILTTPARELTGRALLDEDFLRSRGVRDFEGYAVDPSARLMTDLYVPG